MVLAYDLLEDRRTIDVITTKFFPLCFKMAESFDNLDNLRDWAKDKVQKSLVEALNRYEKQGEERQSRFYFRKCLKKYTRAVSVGSRARLTKHKIGLSKPRTIALSRI